MCESSLQALLGIIILDLRKPPPGPTQETWQVLLKGLSNLKQGCKKPQALSSQRPSNTIETKEQAWTIVKAFTPFYIKP